MRRRVVVLAIFLLFAGAGWLLAEDITLTTYYPSPRGVYDELRTAGDVHIGNVGGGSARLHVEQTEAADAFRVDDTAGDTSPFVIDQNGNVGIGVSIPLANLHVIGTVRVGSVIEHPDYVFEPDFELESIEEHAAYMWKEKHLLAVGKGKVDEEGRSVIEIGSHQMGLLEELEKAHIYIEQIHSRLERLEKKLSGPVGSSAIDE